MLVISCKINDNAHDMIKNWLFQESNNKDKNDQIDKNIEDNKDDNNTKAVDNNINNHKFGYYMMDD